VAVYKKANQLKMLRTKFSGQHKEVCRDADEFKKLFLDCTKVDRKSDRYYNEW